MSNRVTHFEIPCDAPELVMDFFKRAFGWEFEQFGDEAYWMAETGDSQHPGINGGIMKKRDPQQPMVNSIQVSDIEEALMAVQKAGGEVVVPKTALGGLGWFAYFKDPEGNIHGLQQMQQG